MKQFECKFCQQKFEIQKESIPEIIEHLKTHRSMDPVTKKLTEMLLMRVVEGKA